VAPAAAPAPAPTIAPDTVRRAAPPAEAKETVLWQAKAVPMILLAVVVLAVTFFAGVAVGRRSVPAAPVHPPPAAVPGPG
jgi:hypothetical protein